MSSQPYEAEDSAPSSRAGSPRNERDYSMHQTGNGPSTVAEDHAAQDVDSGLETSDNTKPTPVRQPLTGLASPLAQQQPTNIQVDDQQYARDQVDVWGQQVDFWTSQNEQGEQLLRHAQQILNSFTQQLWTPQNAHVEAPSAEQLVTVMAPGGNSQAPTAHMLSDNPMPNAMPAVALATGFDLAPLPPAWQTGWQAINVPTTAPSQPSHQNVTVACGQQSTMSKGRRKSTGKRGPTFTSHPPAYLNAQERKEWRSLYNDLTSYTEREGVDPSDFTHERSAASKKSRLAGPLKMLQKRSRARLTGKQRVPVDDAKLKSAGEQYKDECEQKRQMKRKGQKAVEEDEEQDEDLVSKPSDVKPGLPQGGNDDDDDDEEQGLGGGIGNNVAAGQTAMV